MILIGGLRNITKEKTKSTRFYTPWRILFKESFNTRSEARNREKYLKVELEENLSKIGPVAQLDTCLPAGREQQPLSVKLCISFMYW